jgi:DNA-directed RNA polymerase specialized sigma24 family protein
VDDAVFLAAMDRHKDMIFRVALSCLGSSFDADDVVQDVLLKL